MNEELETDYLVVGGGAAAMAFTDALQFRRDRHDSRSPSRPRRTLDRCLSLRPSPSAICFLWGELGAAGARRPRRGRDECRLLRARRRRRDPSLLRAHNASPFSAQWTCSLFPEQRVLGGG